MSDIAEFTQSGIMSEQIAVTIQNVGEKTLKLDYAMQHWNIEPGKTVYAPYHAACMWFGDPRSVDIPGQNRSLHYRSNELDRLSGVYGLLGDSFVDEPGELTAIHDHPTKKVGGVPYPEDGRHPNLPRVIVHDPTTGARILTVIDDPDGTNNAPVTNEPAERAAIQATVEAQAQIMQAFMKKIVESNPEMLDDPEMAQFLPAGFQQSAPTTAQIAEELGLSGSTSDGLDDDPKPDPAAKATRDGGGVPTSKTSRSRATR